MLNKEGLLLALDGLSSACATAKMVYDGLEVTDQPVQALFAQIETLRMAVQGMSDDELDGCPNCGNADLNRVDTAGGYAIVCPACQSIVSQGEG